MDALCGVSGGFGGSSAGFTLHEVLTHGRCRGLQEGAGGGQGKPFNITVIQVYAPTSNTEEAEVERFYEDLQDLLATWVVPHAERPRFPEPLLRRTR